jgi:acyl-coenzyme A synthetase/AMP-(fatty) acid ligase
MTAEDEIAEAAVIPVVGELRRPVPEIYIALKVGFTPSKLHQFCESNKRWGKAEFHPDVGF